MHDMKIVDLFRLPVFSFKFRDHEKYKDIWLSKIEDEKIWKPKKNKTVTLSDPNLHKIEEFNPLRVFFLECLYEVLTELGMNTHIGLTSMWATKHDNSDFHHSHTHANTLFAGVYYFDSDNKTPSGTVFNNVMGDFYQFNRLTKPVPNRNKLSHSFHYEYEEPFEEGKLVIFPGWLRHTTKKNKSEKRYIIGFNSMPIGQSDSDPYDRYYYQDFRDKQMFGD
jgi:uncharacterized protein (TIGR02466 family)